MHAFPPILALNLTSTSGACAQPSKIPQTAGPGAAAVAVASLATKLSPRLSSSPASPPEVARCVCLCKCHDCSCNIKVADINESLNNRHKVLVSAAWRLAQEAEAERRLEEEAQMRRRAEEDLAVQKRKDAAASAAAAAREASKTTGNGTRTPAGVLGAGEKSGSMPSDETTGASEAQERNQEGKRNNTTGQPSTDKLARCGSPLPPPSHVFTELLPVPEDIAKDFDSLDVSANSPCL